MSIEEEFNLLYGEKSSAVQKLINEKVKEFNLVDKGKEKTIKSLYIQYTNLFIKKNKEKIDIATYNAGVIIRTILEIAKKNIIKTN